MKQQEPGTLFFKENLTMEMKMSMEEAKQKAVDYMHRGYH